MVGGDGGSARHRRLEAAPGRTRSPVFETRAGRSQIGNGLSEPLLKGFLCEPARHTLQQISVCWQRARCVHRVAGSAFKNMWTRLILFGDGNTRHVWQIPSLLLAHSINYYYSNFSLTAPTHNHYDI